MKPFYGAGQQAAGANSMGTPFTTAAARSVSAGPGFGQGDGVATHANAAATGIVLIVFTLAINGVAMYLRYRIRKNLKG